MSIEYINEEKSDFVIVLDSKKQKLNFFISKDNIEDRQAVANIILEISNNNFVHKRINKTIYKELFYKLNRYIDKLNKTNYNM